jgi:hypothetical protein
LAQDTKKSEKRGHMTLSALFFSHEAAKTEIYIPSRKKKKVKRFSFIWS